MRENLKRASRGIDLSGAPARRYRAVVGEYERVKHGGVPGDISRSARIGVREGTGPVVVAPQHTLTFRQARPLQETWREKGRTRP